MSSPFQLTSTQTALALVVPEYLQSEVNSLRVRYDKAYRKWEPHINIIYPFVTPSQLPTAVSILQASLMNSPFCDSKIRFDNVGVFRHRKNATVFLKPTPEAEENLSQLRGSLLGALGCEKHVGTRDGTFRPHLTVGQAVLDGDAIEDLMEKAERLRGLAWESCVLTVLLRQPSGEMRPSGKVFLAAPQHGTGVEDDRPSNNDGWSDCFSIIVEGGWKPLSKAAPTGTWRTKQHTKLNISTYNLMAEPSAPPFQSRLPLVIETLSSLPLDAEAPPRILCLQEVADDMLPLLLADPYIQENYPFSTHCPASVLPSHRNLVTLASIPFRHFTLQFSQRHKSALIIDLFHPGVTISNVHLTSALTEESIAAKRSQMSALTKFLTQNPGMRNRASFVAGDFNIATSSRTIDTALSQGRLSWDTARASRNIIDDEVWEDAFLSSDLTTDGDAEEGEEGATFDPLNNSYAGMCERLQDDRPQRYDRILFPRNNSTKVERFERFGLPKEDGQCASDHYGVHAKLSLEPIGDVTPRTSSLSLRPIVNPLDSIELVEDHTDVQPLLQPYLASVSDRAQRREALELLRQTLSQHDEGVVDLTLAPLGSYAMDTYFSDSDVDILVIGSIAPGIFFDTAVEQLQALRTDGGEEDGLKGVHLVNSLVPIIEVVVAGIKFDLQYCQAPELLRRFADPDSGSLDTLVFDTSLISTLSPTSLRSLNTYRDTAYLLKTLPFLSSYRTAHRFLSLYLRRRGLYSAKFGYLGGIHLSLLLNRVAKLLAATQSEAPIPGNECKPNADARREISAASLVRSFIGYYSTFEWTKRTVSDPATAAEIDGSRSSREPVLIQSIHVPTARPNVAASCTRLSARTLTSELTLAKEKLDLGDWQWCLRSTEECASDFLNHWGAFIRITIDIWDIHDIGSGKVRGMVGELESKIPRLLVGLSRIEGVEGRAWPSRFRTLDIGPEQDDTVKDWEAIQLTGHYLVGVSVKNEDQDPSKKQLLASKVLEASRTFEREVRKSRALQDGHVWVEVEMVPRKKVSKMGLRVDDRSWGASGRYVEGIVPPQPEPQSNEDQFTSNSASTPSPSAARHKKPRGTKLRPAQDVISRIRWDPSLSEDDFMIGYEDRFSGVKEIELNRWKTDQTDLEFIPMHRIVWVRKKGEDGEKVWDRRERIDMLFRSDAH